MYRLVVTIYDIDVIEVQAQHQPEGIIIIVVILHNNIISMPVAVSIVLMTMALMTIMFMAVLLMAMTTVVVMSSNMSRLVTMMLFGLIVTRVTVTFATMPLATIMHARSPVIRMFSRPGLCSYRSQGNTKCQQAYQRKCFKSR